jgi:hypothetical protein
VGEGSPSSHEAGGEGFYVAYGGRRTDLLAPPGVKIKCQAAASLGRSGRARGGSQVRDNLGRTPVVHPGSPPAHPPEQERQHRTILPRSSVPPKSCMFFPPSSIPGGDFTGPSSRIALGPGRLGRRSGHLHDQARGRRTAHTGRPSCARTSRRSTSRSGNILSRRGH